MKTVKGRIIRIVDKRTVIINLGKEHGITNDVIFSIMGEPEQIIDPETDEILGEVKIIKSRVKAKEVAEKFTIATTKWAFKNFKILNAFIDNLDKNVERTEVDEGELNVDESQIEPWKAKSESPIKVGDSVQVEVVDEDGERNKNGNLIDEIEHSSNKENADYSKYSSK